MKPATNATSATAASGGDVPLFERLLFFVLLGVFCARPLISESFERTELSFLSAIGVGGGTTPAASAWLDSLTLTAATAALIRHAGRWRTARWLLLGVGLLAAAVAVSVCAAGEKRLALNAGFSVLVGVLAGAALVVLMRAPWMPRLLLAATLATGCASATKCVVQKAWEFDDTLQYWNEHKPELGPRGVAPDDPTLINFERRLRSGEAFAYQSHSNLTGSLLMMWLLVAGGLLVGWLRGRSAGPAGERGAAVVLCAGVCALLAVGLAFTRSRGAFGGLAVGVLTLLLAGALRRRVTARAGQVTILLGAAYLMVIAAAVVYGVSRGTLPHPSLAFRWHYWTAAVQAFRDAPWTGVGRGNFSDAYLLHKPIESTEDVRDPHNLWLSLLVELGPLGLAAGGILLSGCVRGALRRLDRPSTEAAPRLTVRGWSLAAAAVSVLPLQVLLSGVLLVPGLALLWAVELAGTWVLCLVFVTRLLERVPNPPTATSWQVAGLVAALVAALVHGLIDFALLTPAGLCLFATLAACAGAPWGGAPASPAALPAKRAAGLMGMLLVSAHLLLVTVPTMRAELRLAQMRRVASEPDYAGAYQAVLELGQAAVTSDPLDAAAPREVARLAAALALSPEASSQTRLELLRRATGLALSALARHPNSSVTHARLAAIYEEIEDSLLLDEPDHARRALRQAVGHWQAAVALNPSDPRLRISAGKAWFDWWKEGHEPEAARTSAGHFAAALRIDATRKLEEVMRLRPAELDVIYRHLRTLEAAGFGGPSISAPASVPPP